MTALLERDHLLARLHELRATGGRLVFVGGEAGVGKSSLLRAFEAGLDDRTLRGACESLTTPTPLGPFLDLGLEPDEPRRVAAAVLGELARPSVLLLEDVHWADQATLDVLHVVGRRVDATPSLVLATYRDDEVTAEHPLRVVLGELASAPGVARLSVPRLSPDAVRTLAEPHGVDADALYRLTGGNAFYVTEALATSGAALPETVRDAVLARAARLSPEARRLLDVVALVPGRAELWLLEAVARDDLDALDECLRAGVLQGDDTGAAFRHELARLAVESAVPAHRRRAAHERLLQALSAPHSGTRDPSRLAHHAEEAGEVAAVLEHAPAAARAAAASGAHREAAAQYRRALRFAAGLPPLERAELLAAYGDEASATGRYMEAIVARREAAELYGTVGDGLREGLLRSRLTVPYMRAGRNAEAEDASRRSIEMLEALPPGTELAEAYAHQAYARMLARDNAEGVEWGAKAAALAERVGDHEILAYGLCMIGTSRLMAGDIEQGVADLHRNLDVAHAHDLEHRVHMALGMLGSGLAEMFELEEAERYLHEFLRYADVHELTPWYGRSWVALVDTYRGRWDAAGGGAQRVLAGPSDPISRISALIALGRLRARRGDPGIWTALDEALELALPGGHLQRLGHVRAARAEAAWLDGEPARAAGEARSAYPLALDKRHLWFAGELAYWQRRAGELEEWPDWMAEPWRLQLAGEPRAAAAAWSARGCPYEAARALAESDDAAAVREALGTFEELGAAPAARAARERLRELGAAVPRGPRRSTRANPAALTARELDVLRFVARGLRNADIAAELVLSRRTVDHHVSAILRKLDVRTRGEAAAAAAELGVLQDR